MNTDHFCFRKPITKRVHIRYSRYYPQPVHSRKIPRQFICFLLSKTRHRSPANFIVESQHLDCFLKTQTVLFSQKKWEEDITEKRSMLENEYYENVAHVGEGHQAALMVGYCMT